VTRAQTSYALPDGLCGGVAIYRTVSRVFQVLGCKTKVRDSSARCAPVPVHHNTTMTIAGAPRSERRRFALAAVIEGPPALAPGPDSSMGHEEDRATAKAAKTHQQKCLTGKPECCTAH
jgi:hypothetical protein